MKRVKEGGQYKGAPAPDGTPTKRSWQGLEKENPYGGRKRRHTLHVLLTSAEFEALERAANNSAQSKSMLVRELLRRYHVIQSPE